MTLCAPMIISLARCNSISTMILLACRRPCPRPEARAAHPRSFARLVRIHRIVGVPLWAMRSTRKVGRAFLKSALRTAVPHVVGIGAKPEMCGIAAGWVVAVVQAVKAIGNRAVMKFPRHAMCFVSRLTVTELAITLRVLLSGPRPTLARRARNDVSPKSLRNRLFHILNVTGNAIHINEMSPCR